MPAGKKLSIQETIRQRQGDAFVGRTEELKRFRDNLALSIDSDQRCFVFAISGQGGVGKTSLLHRFRRIAAEDGALSALTDHGETDVIEAMARIATQLAEQGFPLKEFESQHRAYLQLKQRLEADPEAPQGISMILGRALAKGALHLGRSVPGGDIIVGMLDEDAIQKKSGEMISSMLEKIGNKNELRLAQDLIGALTPLFLSDLSQVAEQRQVVLCFDTFERTGAFLEPWLIAVLEGRYGDLSPNVVLVIAGCNDLDPNHWNPYNSVLVRMPFEPLEEPEARDFLARKGVQNEEVVEVILRLSGRLPLLLATLAEEAPSDPSKVGDPSGVAVERFLRWVESPR
ncbi:MAG: ATP-binding protein [Roseiflexaceae bacterium]|nr:ATP-binding protein [Roseiflexaceae bacterium]